MPIYKHIPDQFFPCRDGTFSDHNRRNACSWHGGLRSDEPVSLETGGYSGVVLVPLADIHINTGWFQNRQDHFSTRSVNNIVEAAHSGEFRWSNFDAVTLWRHPEDNLLYMLSGHSRLEAFSRLCAMGARAEGKDFCKIPAKIESGIDLEQAQRIALESNTLGTKETDLERAAYYRQIRLQEDANLSNLKKMAKRMEGQQRHQDPGFRLYKSKWQDLECADRPGGWRSDQQKQPGQHRPLDRQCPDGDPGADRWPRR